MPAVWSPALLRHGGLDYSAVTSSPGLSPVAGIFSCKPLPSADSTQGWWVSPAVSSCCRLQSLHAAWSPLKTLAKRKTESSQHWSSSSVKAITAEWCWRSSQQSVRQADSRLHLGRKHQEPLCGCKIQNTASIQGKKWWANPSNTAEQSTNEFFINAASVTSEKNTTSSLLSQQDKIENVVSSENRLNKTVFFSNYRLADGSTGIPVSFTDSAAGSSYLWWTSEFWQEWLMRVH